MENYIKAIAKRKREGGPTLTYDPVSLRRAVHISHL